MKTVEYKIEVKLDKYWYQARNTSEFCDTKRSAESELNRQRHWNPNRKFRLVRTETTETRKVIA